MRALVLEDRLRFEAGYPEPAPLADEITVRVLKAGICNTDLELAKGYMGFRGVPGHEFVGVVAGGKWDGQRIAGEINNACRRCEFCREGIPTQCSNRTTMGIDRHDGAFADYVTLPAENIHPVPEGVSDDQAVFVEPLAAALQTLHLSHISPHDRVVLIGAGKLGLLTAQMVSLNGCDLVVVARHERQRDLLVGWGIRTAAPGEVKPHSTDVVIDCTGTAEGFADALSLVRPRGVIHLKSTYHGLPQADLTRAVVDEVRIVTSRCGPFPAAINVLRRRLVDVESLIDGRYALEDGLKAFEAAQKKGTLKVLLDINV